MLDLEGRPVFEAGGLDDEELDPSVLSSTYPTSWTFFVKTLGMIIWAQMWAFPPSPRPDRAARALQVKPALDAHGFASRRNAWRIESLQV